jgi:N-acetyl-gamma-glutamyl-phosphate reductase
MKTIFIDGQHGTTGLQIGDRLKMRHDVELLEIPETKRKDAAAKAEYLNQADLVILCLPDGAAVESVSLITNPQTKVIDASTAHRTADGWVYGLPELHKTQRAHLLTATRVTNPGCYPTGFILALYPLIQRQIVPTDYPVTVHAISGYSGGGKRLIAKYQDVPTDQLEAVASRPYALTLNHKHIPEMQKLTGLDFLPLFTPTVGNFYQGTLVSIPLLSWHLKHKPSATNVHEMLAAYYADEHFVKVMPFGGEDALDAGFLSPTGCNGTNLIELFVFGHDEQILLVARLDNLGKGAAGAAVQNLNLMLGFNEYAGL